MEISKPGPPSLHSPAAGVLMRPATHRYTALEAALRLRPLWPPRLLLLHFIARWPILDRGGLVQGGKRLLDGQQDSCLDGAQRSASANRERCSCHRDIIRSLPQGVSVMVAERIPE